jgi:hypothetical protein
MISNTVVRVVFPTAGRVHASLTAALLIALCFVGASAQAGTIAMSPNDLLGGLTGYKLNDYENLYDSAGNVVTNRVAQPGDTIQGVFVITSVQNAQGTALYGPAATIAGSVELTGVFDEAVLSVSPGGYTNFGVDTSTGTGSGSQAKFMSGAAFQSSFGAGSMLAVFGNNTLAMPVGANGNGLNGIGSTAAAGALAMSGTKWATFGAHGDFGGGYYWQGLQTAQTGFGVSTFAASLGFIQNLTGIPSNQFLPMVQSPPVGSPNPGLGTIPNVFIFQGTTNPTDANLAGTPYTIFSTDPAKLNFVPVPEPSSLALIGTFVGVLALLSRYRGKLGR